MPKLHGRFPAYRHHKHSGQAIVTLNGVDHYLGPHGSQVSTSEYDRLIAEWIARGKRPAAASGGVQGTQATLNEIILAFWGHTQAYYRRPDGTPTSEIDNFRQAIRPFRKLYGATLAIEFGPKALKAVREQMIAMGWSRKNINKQIDRIRHILKWAASEELLPASVYEQLRTVPPLRRGRTEALDRAQGEDRDRGTGLLMRRGHRTATLRVLW